MNHLVHQAVDWHRADIVAAIHKSGTTVVGLSRAAGLSNSSLSNVFYRPWPRGERVIAEHLKVPPWVIWPSRYPLINVESVQQSSLTVGRMPAARD